MRVLVCGGRNVGRAVSPEEFGAQTEAIQKASQERAFVLEKMSEFHTVGDFRLVIGGEEGGAERLGVQWAKINDIPTAIYLRERRALRLETTEERNLRMLQTSRPDLVICFAGGESSAKLVALARQMKIPALEVDLPAHGAGGQNRKRA